MSDALAELRGWSALNTLAFEVERSRNLVARLKAGGADTDSASAEARELSERYAQVLKPGP